MKLGEKVLVDGATREGVVVQRSEKNTRVQVEFYHPEHGTIARWYNASEVVVRDR